MRLRKKIVCGVLLAAILGVGALVFGQWNNISAALSFVRFSQAELEEKLANNDRAIKDAVTQVPEVSIRDVTEEERAALRDGTLTQQDLVQSLLQPAQPQPEQPEKVPETKPTQEPEKQPEASSTSSPEQKPAESTPARQETPPQSEYEQKVNELVAEVLVLREEFLIRLDSLQAEALAAYKALPADQRSKSKLLSFASGYLSKGLAMERECDARIEAIVSELEQVLLEYGGDISIAEKVFDTYVEEKSLKKAWYMAELKKRGLV